MDVDAARARFGDARRVVLATNRLDGSVDLVPVTFALVEDTIFTLVDHKPKTTSHLQRLSNVRRDPNVTLLADRYHDPDWSRLWWVRAKGRARIVDDGPERDGIAGVVASRYHQYHDNAPAGPAIVIAVREWKGWSAN